MELPIYCMEFYNNSDILEDVIERNANQCVLIYCIENNLSEVQTNKTLENKYEIFKFEIEIKNNFSEKFQNVIVCSMDLL